MDIIKLIESLDHLEIKNHCDTQDSELQEDEELLRDKRSKSI